MEIPGARWQIAGNLKAKYSDIELISSSGEEILLSLWFANDGVLCVWFGNGFETKFDDLLEALETGKRLAEKEKTRLDKLYAERPDLLP